MKLIPLRTIRLLSKYALDEDDLASLDADTPGQVIAVAPDVEIIGHNPAASMYFSRTNNPKF